MPRAAKLDLYKTFSEDYVASRVPVIVTVRPAFYLAIEGEGAPGAEVFQRKINGLYNVAFTVKMASKFAGRDYAVSKLEAQYHARGNGCFMEEPKETWRWKLLIRTPDFIKKKEIQEAMAHLLGKGKPPEVGEVALEKIEEGRCVQALHKGPYEREGETIELMEEAARKEGLRLHGLHHEIYLSDPRRAAPEKLRTILRHPVR